MEKEVDNELDLAFIPCDLHQDSPSVHMTVTAGGKIIFQCLSCMVN